MLRYKSSILCLFVLIAVGLSGCGDANLKPVTGTLTFKGEKLADMRINFIPVEGTEAPQSSAVTDENGKFTMQTGTNEGVQEGKYLVYVENMTPIGIDDGPTRSDNYLAAVKKFGSEKSSTKRVTVDSSTKEIELSLE